MWRKIFLGGYVRVRTPAIPLEGIESATKFNIAEKVAIRLNKMYEDRLTDSSETQVNHGSNNGQSERAY